MAMVFGIMGSTYRDLADITLRCPTRKRLKAFLGASGNGRSRKCRPRVPGKLSLIQYLSVFLIAAASYLSRGGHYEDWAVAQPGFGFSSCFGVLN